jgi:hypothetical protein
LRSLCGPIRAAALGLLVLSGCGEAAPTPPDAAEARATLEKALEAWRNGETIEAQKSASPAVVVADSKWERGDKLARFEIEEPPSPSGAQQKFRVKLWLVDAKGKEKKDAAQYEVGTEPVRTVFRAMFQ